MSLFERPVTSLFEIDHDHSERERESAQRRALHGLGVVVPQAYLVSPYTASPPPEVGVAAATYFLVKRADAAALGRCLVLNFRHHTEAVAAGAAIAAALGATPTSARLTFVTGTATRHGCVIVDGYAAAAADAEARDQMRIVLQALDNAGQPAIYAVSG